METGINLFSYNDEISVDRQIELMRENGSTLWLKI